MKRSLLLCCLLTACVGPLPGAEELSDAGVAPMSDARAAKGTGGVGGGVGGFGPPSNGGAGAAPVGGMAAVPIDTSSIQPLTDVDWAQLRTLSPLPPLPADTTNRYADNDGAALLGQRLFFDARYSGAIGASGIGPARIACASCHVGPGLDQPRIEIMQSKAGPYKKRDTLGLINASYYHWINWGGRFSAQWELPLAVAENPNIMNSDRLTIAHHLFSFYRSDYETTFGPLPDALGSDFVRFPPSGKPASAIAPPGAWENMGETDRTAVNQIFVNYGKALGAYLRKLVSRTSRFDEFVAGNGQALSAFEAYGAKLFVGKGRCIDCHAGPAFTDNRFYDLKLPSMLPNMMMDLGRFDDIPPLLASPFNTAGNFSDDRTTGRLAGLTSPPPFETQGQFRTPSLRNVALTGPFGHQGLIRSLDEAVVLHRPGLSSQELQAVLAFLTSLNTDPLPAALLNEP